jgi:streptogramin lyase
MSTQYPRLAETVHSSVDRPAKAADGSVWLGTEVTQDVGRWDRLTGRIGSVADGRGGTLLIVLVGVAVVLFGFRSRPRRKPATPA